jgi:hypothetical protein
MRECFSWQKDSGSDWRRHEPEKFKNLKNIHLSKIDNTVLLETTQTNFQCFGSVSGIWIQEVKNDPQK